jgi:hypothetical protein
MATKIKPSKLTTLAQQKPAEPKFPAKQTVQWLMNKIAELKNVGAIPGSIAREKTRENKKFLLGCLYFFFYDPKGKEDLPYYDKFPLILLLQKYPDGFLGLNLHYLPIRYRIAFLGKLLKYASYDENDEIKKIRITYDILNATRQLKEFRPCLKRYLTSHIRSKILTVAPNEWDVATFLPVHQFKKAKPKEIWEDVKQEIKES